MAANRPFLKPIGIALQLSRLTTFCIVRVKFAKNPAMILMEHQFASEVAMEAVLLTLLLWINQHTHYEYDARAGLPSTAASDQMTLARLIIDDQAELNRERHTPSFQNFVNQLEAVYDHLLRPARVRFLLADDAGAGKTIMAGLYVREMLSRRLVQRVLIVPPAGLAVKQQRALDGGTVLGRGDGERALAKDLSFLQHTQEF